MANEIQEVTFNAVPGAGNWELLFGDFTTGSLAYNASNSAIATALAASAIIASTSNLSITGSYSSGITIQFIGALANMNWPQMSTATSDLATSDKQSLSCVGSSYAATAAGSAAPTGQSPISVCARFKVLGGSSFMPFITLGAGIGGMFSMGVAIGGQIYVTNDTLATPSGGSGADDGSWHDAVATWDGGNNFNLYLDGLNVFTDSSGYFASTNISGGTLGFGYDGLNVSFVGELADVAIYNSELSSSDVTTYHGGSIPGSPVDLWTFNDMVADSGSGADDATLGSGSYVQDYPGEAAVTITVSTVQDGSPLSGSGGGGVFGSNIIRSVPS